MPFVIACPLAGGMVSCIKELESAADEYKTESPQTPKFQRGKVQIKCHGQCQQEKEDPKQVALAPVITSHDEIDDTAEDGKIWIESDLVQRLLRG